VVAYIFVRERERVAREPDSMQTVTLERVIDAQFDWLAADAEGADGVTE